VFAVECHRHGRRVLLPQTRIRGLYNTAIGILVQLECWCGARLTVRTGRLAERQPELRRALHAERQPDPRAEEQPVDHPGPACHPI
jgi:hypothetical protein